MPDDLALISLERALRLGIDRRHHIDIGHRIRPALGDGIPKELKDIIALPPFEAMMVRAVPDAFGCDRILRFIVDIARYPGRIRGMRRRIPLLSGRRETAPGAGQCQQKKCNDRSHQPNERSII